MSSSHESRPTLLDKLRTKPAAALLVAFGVAGLSACGSSAEAPKANSSSEVEVAENVSGQIEQGPKKISFPEIEGMNEQQWSQAVNASIINEMSWWLVQKAQNPDADIEKPFTSDPNSYFAELSDDIAEEIIANTDYEKDFPMIVSVGEIATDSPSAIFDPNNVSSLVRDTSAYPNMSSISVMYSQDPSEDSGEIYKLIDDNYTVDQLEDGTLTIN